MATLTPKYPVGTRVVLTSIEGWCGYPELQVGNTYTVTKVSVHTSEVLYYLSHTGLALAEWRLEPAISALPKESTKQVNPLDAPAILELVKEVHEERGKTRDAEQERSMNRAVAIYKAMTGIELTESEGWKFMLALKFARMAQGGFHFDDYVDAVGYSALLAECVSKEKLNDASK